MDPRGLNKKAIEQRKHFVYEKKILSDISSLHGCAPYFGWVKMDSRDIYMYLNGKDDGVAMRWFWLNTFETTSLVLWEKLSRLFETIIDVGAHTGCYSLTAAKINPEKTILAIEPLPANLARLSMNREYNDLKNISIMPAAAFSTNTFLAMKSINNYNFCASGNAALENKFDASNGNRQVKAFRLNDLPSNFSRKALIKVDTEGQEHHVITGANDYLKARSWLICESTNKKASDALEKIFIEQNYSFFIINDEEGKIYKSNSLSPISKSSKLDKSCLNRLIIPTEQLATLKTLLA